IFTAPRNHIMMRMTRLRPVVWLFVAIVGFATVRSAAAQSREPYPGFDTYVAKAMQTWKIPGLSIAIVRNDSVIYAKGFGILSAQSRAPVNERTLFEIGSSSKAFTATLVAMFVSDGKMHWDDKLTQYLPEFRMYDAVANEGVTLRDALSHRTGIARGELAWLGSGISRDEVLHRVRFLKPESPFRSRYSYQNMMFLAAGQAVGKATGSSWDDQVRQRIFVPLGMTSTVATSRGLANPNVAAPHGVDHDTVYVKPPFDAENIAPAGAILSSAVDMAQWLRFQLNDGVVAGKRLVSNAALRETHTPQILMGAGAGAREDTASVKRFSSYAMGWMVEDFRNQLSWQHGGNTLGMTAAVGMLPEKKVGVVVLSNMQGAALPMLLEEYVFDRELGAPMKDWSGEAYERSRNQRRRADSLQTVQLAGHPANAQPSIPLSAFAGTYADSLYGEMTVSVKEGHLELARADVHAPLEYWNANNFKWLLPLTAPTAPAFIKFEITPENTVTGLYFGLGSDVTLLGRKGAGRGGRGGVASAP
ncbi:MAG TPA: serine hydrolase, partial [Gemmatimonadaceae bacterium]|nr:serine hydrolase [Gemmatimonadaceae bacterium]